MKILKLRKYKKLYKRLFKHGGKKYKGKKEENGKKKMK
jgi:hypothetical protein